MEFVERHVEQRPETVSESEVNLRLKKGLEVL